MRTPPKGDDALVTTLKGMRAVCKSMCATYKIYGFTEGKIWPTYKQYIGLPVSIVKGKLHRGPRGMYYPEGEIQMLRDTASRKMTPKAREALRRRDRIRKLKKEINELSRIDNL